MNCIENCTVYIMYQCEKQELLFTKILPPFKTNPFNKIPRELIESKTNMLQIGLHYYIVPPFE